MAALTRAGAAGPPGRARRDAVRLRAPPAGLLESVRAPRAAGGLGRRRADRPGRRVDAGPAVLDVVRTAGAEIRGAHGRGGPAGRALPGARGERATSDARRAARRALARWRPARGGPPAPASLDTKNECVRAGAAWPSPTRASPRRSSRRRRSRGSSTTSAACGTTSPGASPAARAPSPTSPTTAPGVGARRGRGLHAGRRPRDADGVPPHRPCRRGLARRGSRREGRRRRCRWPTCSAPAGAPGGTPMSDGVRSLLVARQELRPCGPLALDADLRGRLRGPRPGRRRVGLRPVGRSRRPGLRAHGRLPRPARAAARAAHLAPDRRPGAGSRPRRGGAALLATGLAPHDPAREAPRPLRGARRRPGAGLRRRGPRDLLAVRGTRALGGFAAALRRVGRPHGRLPRPRRPASAATASAAAGRGPSPSRSSSGSWRSSSSTSPPSASPRCSPRARPRAS